MVDSLNDIHIYLLVSGSLLPVCGYMYSDVQCSPPAWKLCLVNCSTTQ